MKKFILILIICLSAYSNGMKQTILDIATPLPKDMQKIIISYLYEWIFEHVEEISMVDWVWKGGSQTYKSPDGLFAITTVSQCTSNELDLDVRYNNHELVTFKKAIKNDRLTANAQYKAKQKTLLLHMLGIARYPKLIKTILDLKKHIVALAEDKIIVYDKFNKNFDEVPYALPCQGLTVSEDGKYCATGNNQTIQILNLKTGTVDQELNPIVPENSWSVQRVAFSPDGFMLIALLKENEDSRNKMILIWKHQARELELTI